MRFSIITPSFKQLDHLKRCAASISDQAGDFGIEHLVHDGGSGPEMEEWALEPGAPSVVIEEDEGMYDAINRGFLRCKGEIVAWLNCDEQYLAGTLAKVSEWFDANPRKDMLFGDVVIVSKDFLPISYRTAVPPVPGHIRHCFLPTYSAATFFRRRIIDEGNLLESGKIAIADALWIHGLLKKGCRRGTLNEPLSAFMQTGKNLGQSPAGIEESERWRGKSPMRRCFWEWTHRFRKVFHGCYRRKEVTIHLYAGNLTGRQPRSAVVGGIWKAS